MANLTRRDLLKATGAGAAALTLSGLTSKVWAQEGPIQLGAILPMSGIQETIGRPQLLGAQIAVKQINDAGGVNGRLLELVVRDDKADPATGVAHARELAASGVNLFLGGVSTAVVLAIKPLLPQLNSVLISTSAISDVLTTDDLVPNYFRGTDSSTMRYRSHAKLNAQRYPEVTSWIALVPNAAFGQSTWGAFKSGLEEYYPSIAGKEITIAEPVTFEFGATDFRNQISALMQSPATGLVVIANGADGITFYQQAASFGLLQKMQVVSDTGQDVALAKAMGARTPALWTSSAWFYGLHQDNPMGKALYEELLKADPYPDGYSGPTHLAVTMYADAIKKAGSTDTAAIISTLESTEFDTCKGKLSFNTPNHQASYPSDFFLFAPKDGEPGWQIADSVMVQG